MELLRVFCEELENSMPARRALASLRRRRISAIVRTCSSGSVGAAVSKGECDNAAVEEDVVSGLNWF